MKRMFTNCRAYNSPETEYFNCANVLERFFTNKCKDHGIIQTQWLIRYEQSYWYDISRGVISYVESEHWTVDTVTYLGYSGLGNTDMLEAELTQSLVKQKQSESTVTDLQEEKWTQSYLSDRSGIDTVADLIEAEWT